MKISFTCKGEKQCLRTSDFVDILLQDKRYENVTINCIDEKMGIPLYHKKEW